jgi:DNA modification methylase
MTLPRAAGVDLADAPNDAVAPVSDSRAEPLSPPPRFFTVHQGDARRLELLLSRYSSPSHPLLTCTITSPPYGTLKDYGDPAQIGFGQPHDEYLVDMRRVFRSLHRHTRPDGSLWVVADTLRPPERRGGPWRMQLLPFELAREAESVGWILRDVVIWLKDKTLPWSGRGRMRNAFEYVLFFVRSPKFKYRVERLREPTDLEQWWVRYPERYNPQGKSPTNVWAVPIPVQGSWANTAVRHACPLPADLIERMLLLSSDEQDVVLDPFAGSGMVVAEATRLRRRGVGVELISRHVAAFHSTVLPEITERRGVDVLRERQQHSDALQRTITNLRIVKYPKAMLRTLREMEPTLPDPYALYVLASRRRDRDGRVRADLLIILRDSEISRGDEFRRAAAGAMRRRPASKFGISANVSIVSIAELTRVHRGRKLWAYLDGRTHSTVGRCTMTTVHEQAMKPSRHRVPVIVSNVEVHETPRRLLVEA